MPGNISSSRLQTGLPDVAAHSASRPPQRPPRRNLETDRKGCDDKCAASRQGRRDESSTGASHNATKRVEKENSSDAQLA